MQFTTSFFALAAIVSVVVATPVNKRDGSVTLCNQTDFNGDCFPVGYGDNVCVSINVTGFGLASFGVDATTSCTLFEGPGCTGTPSVSVAAPGVTDTVALGFTDSISINCA